MTAADHLSQLRLIEGTCVASYKNTCVELLQLTKMSSDVSTEFLKRLESIEKFSPSKFNAVADRIHSYLLQ